MTGPPMYRGDRNEILAAADLAERAGATGFEISHDDECDPVTWQAQAVYRGLTIYVAGQPSPQDAATSLAVRLLTGAACRCGQKVALRDGAAGCRWRLTGPKWVPGCDAPSMTLPTDKRGNVRALRSAVEDRAAIRRRGEAS